MLGSDTSQCAAKFKPDPDIAGPGVIVSFVLTAWVTCLIAILDVHCGVARKCQTFLDNPNPPLSLSEKILGRWARFTRFLPITFRTAHPRLKRFTKPTLEALCDIQIITSTAILIAAFVQLETMTFYHQSLILSYCFLTLNSFWAARFGFLNTLDDNGEDNGEEERSWHFWTRTVAVTCALVLFLVYQVIVIPRMAHMWESDTSGLCLQYHDYASYGNNFLWMVGTGISSIYLVGLLLLGALEFLSGKNLKGSVRIWKDKKETNLREWYFKVTRQLLCSEDGSISTFGSSSEGNEDTPHFRQALQFTLKVLLIYAIPMIYWLWGIFLALWAWGSSESVVLLVVLLGFAAWNTFDIIDVKLSNAQLLSESEMTWGFGQVLAAGLLALILLQILDFVEKSRQVHDATGSERGSSEEIGIELGEARSSLSEGALNDGGLSEEHERLLLRTPPYTFPLPWGGECVISLDNLSSRSPELTFSARN